jgi:PPM family protein phosphatase
LIDKARTRGRGTGDNLSLVIVKLEPLEEEVVKTTLDIPSIQSLRAGKA